MALMNSLLRSFQRKKPIPSAETCVVLRAHISHASSCGIDVRGSRPQASKLQQQAIHEYTSVRRVDYTDENAPALYDGTHEIAEQRLQLITAADSLWTSQHTDGLPFPEPWWAFLWPGGYGITRFVFEQSIVDGLISNARVLDLGSGCGSVALAAIARGATDVVANDIDEWAGPALAVNAVLSNVSLDNVRFSQDNFLNWESSKMLDRNARAVAANFDVVIAGDLLYDQDIGPRVLKLLSRSLELSNTSSSINVECANDNIDLHQHLEQTRKLRVFVGDPGRHVLTELGIDVSQSRSMNSSTFNSVNRSTSSSNTDKITDSRRCPREQRKNGSSGNNSNTSGVMSNDRVRHTVALEGTDLASLELVARYSTPESFHAEHNGIRHANVWEMLLPMLPK